MTKFDPGATILTDLSNLIGKAILRPELGAAVSQCLLFNRKLTETYLAEVKTLTDYARVIQTQVPPTGLHRESSIGESRHWLEHDEVEFNELLSSVETLVEEGVLNEIINLNKVLRSQMQLPTRFGFFETAYGILVPQNACKRLGEDFHALVKKAKTDKSTLLAMSPRQFEEFISNLFTALGYKVQLTKATRDGGADLICLQTQHGIPFKLAVEVKRYKQDNPVSVELIRSFVGSNEQFQANKLIYITTSSYTKPALEYADACGKALITLKDYEQVREWCEEAGRETWHLLS